jgi:hypothetical protein
MMPTDDNELPSHRKGPSLLAAMACYAAIAVLAAFTLDGNFRLVVWIFLAGLAVRTYLATLRKP